MQRPDDINLSDACLMALRDAGWIGKLVVKGAPKPQPKAPRLANRFRDARRKMYPKPDGLHLPPGVEWDVDHGKLSVRVSIKHRMRRVCVCAPTQASADLAGELVLLARRLRDDGADLDTIRQCARERMALARVGGGEH